MAQQPPDEAVLDIALEEARKKYDHIRSDHKHVGTKIFTLLATELAIITFLFANDGSFLPQEVYGIIFYAIGIAAVLLAAALLFWGISSNAWAIPAEAKELRMLRYSPGEFKQYLKDDYLEAYAFCAQQYDRRRLALDWSIRLFVAGVTILMIIKFGA